jgi:hypothetical protein
MEVQNPVWVYRMKMKVPSARDSQGAPVIFQGYRCGTPMVSIDQNDLQKVNFPTQISCWKILFYKKTFAIWQGSL